MRFYKTILACAGMVCALLQVPCSTIQAQTTAGGRTAFNFLRLPASPLLAAAGGINTSYTGGDVGLAANNPALLKPSSSKQLYAGFHSLLAGTKGYSVAGAYYAEKAQTTFSSHVHFIDHGSLPATDAAGNVTGNFRPVEYLVQVSAAKAYLQHWNYGLAVKLVQSSYGPYRSHAVAADVGVLFEDSARQFSASLLVKNMGVQLKAFAGENEDLPFDLQAGFTKRLKKAPFGFSLTAQRLHRFAILYNDTLFNRDNNLPDASSTLTKLLTHMVLASHLYLGSMVEATVGYNVLQRQELRVGTEGNGLTGFSAGLRLRFSKLQVHYARSAYQRGVGSNQIGITVHLDRLAGW